MHSRVVLLSCALIALGPLAVAQKSNTIYSGVFWIHSAYVYGSDSNCQNNDWATGVGAVEFK